MSAAGGLADNPKGRIKYEDYLKWLSNDNTAQKEFAFDKMCRGWAIGIRDFKKALLKEAKQSKDDGNGGKVSERDTIPRYDGVNLREANELQWELLLEKGLSVMEKNSEVIANDKKPASWKVLLAALVKQKSSTTNVWITQKLNMGTSDAVSRSV